MLDPYLDREASFTRLMREYELHGSLVVGYDFDSTVFDYHNNGEDYPAVTELLRQLKSIGCKLICWTATRDLEFVKQYLAEKNIPCDGINTDGIKLPWESRKPFFSTLLDDRVGLAQVYEELSILVFTVKKHKGLI